MMPNCPLCGHSEPVGLDQRARVPVVLNQTFASAAEALAAPSGVLDMAGCRRCGFVWNRRFDPALMAYTEEYENDQSCSPHFQGHISGMAGRVALMDPSDPAHVLEVGAGQGKFLAVLEGAFGPRLATAIGFDPAYRGDSANASSRMALHPDVFEPRTAPVLRHPPTSVVSRHTIEHVPAPLDFLRQIADGLPVKHGVKIAIETPCVQWILDHDAVQDLFYEHCSLFTAGSLAFAMENVGISVSRIDHVFGGQYLWAEGAFHAPKSPVSRAKPGSIPEFGRWQEARHSFRTRWQSDLQAASDRPVYVWGAGAKGVTFALLAAEWGARIDALIDINPAKQGRFIPLTGLAVLAPEAIAGQMANVIVMNPNYIAEVRGTCQTLGVNGTVMCL